MKKIILLASLMLSACIVQPYESSGQSTSPRFGTASNQNATYTGQKLSLASIADAASATTDTLTVSSSAIQNYIKVTLTDSVSISVNTVGSCLGDKLTFIIYNSSGANHCVYFTSKSGAATNWRNASTGNKISLATSKNATVEYVFDGTKYSELSRSIQ